MHKTALLCFEQTMGQYEEIQRLTCPYCGTENLVTVYGMDKAYITNLPQRPNRFDRPEKQKCVKCQTRFTYYLVEPLEREK